MRKITCTIIALFALAGCASSETADPPSTEAPATSTTAAVPACAELRPGVEVPESLGGCTLADGTVAPTDGIVCPDGRRTYVIPSSPQSIGIDGGEFEMGVGDPTSLQILCGSLTG